MAIGVSKILTPLYQDKLYNTYNVRVCIGGAEVMNWNDLYNIVNIQVITGI